MFSLLAYRLSPIHYRSYNYQYMSLRQGPMDKADNNRSDSSAIQREQKLHSNAYSQLSHEFRTPLTSIIGFAEMLEDSKEIDSKTRTEYAQFIRKEGLRLAKIVEDIVTLNALKQGNMHFNMTENCVQDIFNQIYPRIETYAESKSITFSLDIPVEPISLNCDDGKLSFALYQLLYQAVKFTKSNKTISILITTIRNNLYISLSSEGNSILIRDIPHVLKELEKMTATGDETHYSGTELTLAQYIIEQHGGKIIVENPAGKGLNFFIKLPILQVFNQQKL
jgi:two-component system, OmpR family, phosphate regulon sensor histidine kinase PhoR